MAKKGQASQLQVEINSEEDWEKLLQRDGLIVVDVFSEWCGPCTGMSANLKKIKLEIGGDNLHLAMAKSDNIAVLERFRDKSEPTWMFLSNGKMVNLMFGPNAPKLQRLITDELKHLQAVREGATPRMIMEITELSQEEKVRAETVDKVRLEAARVEAEAVQKAHHERELATCENILSQFERHGVVLALPNSKDIILGILGELWEPANLFLHKQEKIKLTQEDIDQLMYFSRDYLDEEVVEFILEKQCLAMIIETAEDFVGDPIERIRVFCFGPTKEPPGSKDCLLVKIKDTILQQKQEAEAAAKALEAMEQGSVMVQESQKSESIQEKPEKAESVTEDAIVLEDEPITLEGLTDDTPAQKPPEQEKEEDIMERETDWYIWTPHNRFATANAIKVFFPRMAEHHIVAEPPPIPDHIAVSYDAFKRKEIMEAIAEYPDDVMRFGFFTCEDPETAKLIAKTVPKFEAKAAETQYGEKLVIQLSKKRSDALLTFAQLGPTYMSANAVDGKRECKLFFPEGYDDLQEEVVEVKKKPSKKKLKKPSVTSITAGEEAPPGEEMPAITEEEIPMAEEGAEGELKAEEVGEETAPGEEVPEGGEGVAGGEEAPAAEEGAPPPEGAAEGEPAEADKATSPEAEPPSDVETEPPSEPATTTEGDTTAGDTTETEGG